MDDAIRIFIDRILHSDGADVRQVAWHEAGHRLMWSAMFPEAKTHYGVRDGLPCVIRDDGAHSLQIADMTVEEASRYIYIKLGGIAAEMVMLGIGERAEAVAAWVSSDCLEGAGSKIDWDDDAVHGGDISEAARIVIAKTGRQSLRHNLARTLCSCVRNIQNNMDDFGRECTEAESFFSAMQAAGLLHLE